VHALAADALAAKLYAGADNGVHSSTNGGQNWSHTSLGLPERAFVNTLLVSGPNLYAGIFGGVYLSTGQGVNWLPANTGLAHRNVFSLAVIGSTLVAGTIGGGAYGSQ